MPAGINLETKAGLLNPSLFLVLQRQFFNLKKDV